MAIVFPKEPTDGDLVVLSGKTYKFARGSWRIHIFSGPDNDDGTYPWQKLRNVPVDFPPSSHSHQASQLVGVVKTINGNAPDEAGNVVVTASGGFNGVLQETTTLAQGNTLKITHAPNPGKNRLIEILEYFPSVLQNMVPVMTSPNSPLGQVISNGTGYSGDWDPWKAFDSSLATASGITAAVSYIGYMFVAPTEISSYALTSGPAANSYFAFFPKAWTFEGSDNGTNWTVLDTRVNQASTAGNQVFTYDLTGPVTYKYYRLNFSASNNGGMANFYNCISKLEFKNTPVAKYQVAQSGDYQVVCNDLETVITKLSAGSKTILANVILG